MTANLISRLRRWWNKSSGATRPIHDRVPRLEALENRTVPSTTDVVRHVQPNLNDTFVATLYQGELHRPVDDGGLAYWRGQVDQSGRAQAAAGLLNSNEFRGQEIQADFQALLGHAPDAAGMQFYLQAFQGGATPQQVKASIMASDEFFTRAGGNGNAFLNAVYAEELGRPVDAQGQAFWMPLTTTAVDRNRVVLAVEGSSEATQRFVSIVYQDFLGRNADTNGLAYWSGHLQQGQSQMTVLAGILGSDEFYQGMRSYVAQTNTTDPNVAAKNFITDAHLFQGQSAVMPAQQQQTQTQGQGNNSL